MLVCPAFGEFCDQIAHLVRGPFMRREGGMSGWTTTQSRRPTSVIGRRFFLARASKITLRADPREQSPPRRNCLPRPV